MTLSAMRWPLLAGLVLGALVSIRLSAWPLVRVELPPRAELPGASGARDSLLRLRGDSAAVIVARDPFRIARRPATVVYDPLRLAEQLAPPLPKPNLLLVGLVSGADPSAVIEGLPGVEGSRILRVGDVVAGLVVKGISGNRVVIVGMDTTWVLEVREPWKN